MVTFETAEAASTALRAQRIVSSHGRWDVQRPHTTMWFLWKPPRIPGRNDCKHSDSPRTSERPQRPASLSETSSPIILLSSSRKRDGSLHAISQNSSSGSPRNSLHLHGSAEEHEPSSSSPQQRPDPSQCQVSQLVHSADATAQEPSIPCFSGESEEKQRLTLLEQKLEERGELLKAAVDALQAEIAKRKALEVELEDWRMKGRMVPELLKTLTSLEALVDLGSGTLSETTSSLMPSSSTDTPGSKGNERRKRPKL